MTKIHQVYSTVELNQVVSNIEECICNLKPQLTTHEAYDEESFDYFIALCREIARIAPSYDFHNIPCNGWRSLLRMNQHFLFRSLDSLKRKEIADVCFSVKTMSFYMNGLIEAHRLSAQGKEDEKLAVHCKLFAETDAIASDLMSIMCNSRYLSLNCPQLKFFSTLLMRAFAHCYESNLIAGFRFWILPFSSVSASFVRLSEKLDSKKVARAIRFVDVTAPRLGARFLYAARTLFDNIHLKIQEHEVHVKSRYRFNIDRERNETVLEKATRPMHETIKFRTIKNCDENSEFKNKIFLYIHGGAFFGPKASSLEDIYVKSWCKQLGGCTFINFDYPYAPEHRFPSQIQVILDFYLWLTSDDARVIEIFNFKPNEIVVGGDSAGANLTISLMIALNEIKRMDESVNIKMPKSIVGMFGVYQMQRNFFPSWMATASEVVLLFQLMKIVAHYGRHRIYSLSEDGNNNVIKTHWKLAYVDGARSFLTDDSIELEPTPYIHSLLYKHFDDQLFKSVDLFILALDFCPFLDQSVALAKLWKGNVTFRHVDSTFHAALFANILFPQTVKSLMETCVDLIQNALRA